MTQQSLTSEEQDALFHVIIKKIPTIRDPRTLQELVIDALELMLRREEDHDLKTELIDRAHQMFVPVDKEAPSPERDRKVHRLAHDCLEVLQSAKEKRPSRQVQYPQRP